MESVILASDYTICNPDWSVNAKHEGLIRIYYVLGGDAEYTDEYTSCKLEANNLYVFFNDNYKITHQQSNPLEVLWLHAYISIYKKGPMLCIKIEPKSLIHTLLYALELSIKMHSNTLEDIAKLLLMHLKEDFGAFDLFYKEQDKIMLHLLNINKPQKNAQLAKDLGYSEKYFIELFSKRYGVTPQLFLKKRLLQKAALMLKNGSGVNETSEICGYSLLNNFCRDFKKQFGQSPSQYSKSGIITP